ncbi:MAG: Helix-turn-helix domain [Verrucomicrobiota bacterium]|jgi:excisionase family DNA binding protein
MNDAAVDTRKKFVRKITNTKQSEQGNQAPAITHPTMPLVRAKEIARHFDVHERTVCMWAQNGVIPCVRIGGALRFNLEAIIGGLS